MNEQSDNSRKNILREAQRQIVRSAFFALAALAVIVFACYAWFVSSGTVTANGVAVRIEGSSFELGSVGGKSNQDTILSGLQEDVKQGTEETINGITMSLTGGNSNILWRVNENSHLENLENYTDEDGISPGSSGKLEFYVIPKKDGPLKIRFNVGLLSLGDNGTQVTNIDDSTLNNLLQGHFLFFYSCAVAEVPQTKTLLKYNDHSFSLSFPNAKTDEPIPVTIDWLWPEFLRDVIDGEFGSVIRQWIEAPIGEGVKPSTYFFYNNGDPIGDFSIENDFRKLNSYYNNGDEYIGSKVKRVVLKLTAEET